MSLWDDDVHGDVAADDGRAPICPVCGVTALPSESAHVVDATFVCENPDCEGCGDEVS